MVRDDERIWIRRVCFAMVSTSDMDVLRFDERLGDVVWLAPQEISAPRVGNGDCMVVCAGFEERSVEALRRTVERGTNPSRVVVITYQPSYAENRRDEICGAARSAGIEVLEVMYDRRDPAGIGDEVGALVGGFDRVFVDISGMSRFLIVQTLVALLTGIGSLVVLYSEAAVYFPTKDQLDRDLLGSIHGTSLSYLSAGIFEVATDAALSSVAMPGAEIRLIVFPTFAPVQLKNLVDELQPTYTDLVHGVRAMEEYRWREEAICALNRPVISAIQNCNEHSASTLDYRDTLGILLDLYRTRSMFDRLVVAPTGSKLQAVAVGLFRAVLYDVQVVYPTPRVFTEPRRYTAGVCRLYSVDISVEGLPIE